MELERFESLIKEEESKTVDFKRELYDFSESNKKSSDSNFIKDVISMYNTKRVGSSFLVFGIDDSPGKRDLIGLNNLIDESVLQDKIKDKVDPIPDFKLHYVNYSNLNFAILEVYLPAFSKPTVPVRDFGIIRKDEIYIRRGSVNAKAKPEEIKTLYDWFDELTLARKKRLKHIEDLKSFVAKSLRDDEVFELSKNSIFEEGRKIGLSEDEINIIIIDAQNSKYHITSPIMGYFIVSLIGLIVIFLIYLATSAIRESILSNSIEEKVILYLESGEIEKAKSIVFVNQKKINNRRKLEQLIMITQLNKLLKERNYEMSIELIFNSFYNSNLKARILASPNTSHQARLIQAYNNSVADINILSEKLIKSMHLNGEKSLLCANINLLIGLEAKFVNNQLSYDSTNLNSIKTLVGCFD